MAKKCGFLGVYGYLNGRVGQGLAAIPGHSGDDTSCIEITCLTILVGGEVRASLRIRRSCETLYDSYITIKNSLMEAFF